MRTFDSDELKRRVDEVLFYVWDPIGVSNEPCARWEYKNYVPGVLHLLSENNFATPISLHLAAIVKDRLELSPDLQKCNEVAELLLQHKLAISEGLA